MGRHSPIAKMVGGLEQLHDGLYNLNDNGKISFDDMLTVVQAIYVMVRHIFINPSFIVIVHAELI
jgi:hypothetical protein